MTTTTAPVLAPGTRATVTRTITDTWVGDIPAGTVVTIVEFEPEHVAPATRGEPPMTETTAADLVPLFTEELHQAIDNEISYGGESLTAGVLMDQIRPVLHDYMPRMMAAELRRLADELDIVREEMRATDDRTIRSSGLGEGIRRLRARADELNPA